MASAAAALAAPGLAALYTGVKTNRALDSLQTAASAVARASYALRRISAEEATVARFVNSRRSFTMLVGALSVALPDSTAITSLHVDSTGGTAVVLSPAGAQVLGALDSLPDVLAPQIVGPIASQSVGGAPLQRIAIRFRFPNSARVSAAGHRGSLPLTPRGP
jgi:hypothetical protein